MARPTPDRPGRDRGARRSPRVLVLLVLAALAVLSVDAGVGDGALSDPVRGTVGAVLGPAEGTADGLAAPVRAVGDLLRGGDDERIAALETENARLREQLGSTGVDRNRLAEHDALTRTSATAGVRTLRARVVGLGGAQSFSRTVTIDRGSADGVRRDMTVLNGDGLVGRVLRSTRTHATVLLLVDQRSTVGGRLGTDNELGFLRGDGSLSGSGRLVMTTVDSTTSPQRGDSIVSWGSPGAVPYVAGVPIGRVEQVTSQPRAQSRRVVVAPYVDFSSLDVVGVVTGPDTGRTTAADGEADGG